MRGNEEQSGARGNERRSGGARSAEKQAGARSAEKQAEARESVLEALYKRAVGCSADEVVEEYSVGEDGSLQLVKQRVKKRELPPDMAAVRLLLEAEKPLASLSDEELEAEKQRLLGLLAQGAAGGAAL